MGQLRCVCGANDFLAAQTRGYWVPAFAGMTVVEERGGVALLQAGQFGDGAVIFVECVGAGFDRALQ